MKILAPKDCSTDEINSFYNLVAQGGQVNIETLKSTILSAAYLAFKIVDKEIVSVASIKQPLEGYKTKVFKKAGVESLSKKYKYELGHAFTLERHRRKGYSQELLNGLLAYLPQEYFYATTKNENVPAMLQQAGFVETGNGYTNNDNESLKLFTRNPK